MVLKQKLQRLAIAWKIMWRILTNKNGYALMLIEDKGNEAFFNHHWDINPTNLISQHIALKLTLLREEVTLLSQYNSKDIMSIFKEMDKVAEAEKNDKNKFMGMTIN